MTTDSEGKILECIKPNGTIYINSIESPVINDVYSKIPDVTPIYEDIENIYEQISDFGNPVNTSYSKRCFALGKKSPIKPCVTITVDLYKDFSFSQKSIFDYINLLKTYGIASSSFFPRPKLSEIGEELLLDLQNIVNKGQEICIHSVAGDNWGATDTGTHPTIAEAEILI